MIAEAIVRAAWPSLELASDGSKLQSFDVSVPTSSKLDAAHLELHCAAYQLKQASIYHGPKGAVYSCQCGPLSPVDMSGIEHAARSRTRIRLVFPDAEILLAEVHYAALGEDWAFIEGVVIATKRSPEQ